MRPRALQTFYELFSLLAQEGSCANCAFHLERGVDVNIRNCFFPRRSIISVISKPLLLCSPPRCGKLPQDPPALRRADLGVGVGGLITPALRNQHQCGGFQGSPAARSRPRHECWSRLLGRAHGCRAHALLGAQRIFVVLYTLQFRRRERLYSY